MSSMRKPIIKNISYSNEELVNSLGEWQQSDDSKFLLRYPTVYIINDKNKSDHFNLYVGETTDIKNRTIQHLKMM